MPSPAGWRDVPCAQCGTRVDGIALGDRCPACQRLRGQRANRLARRISLGATALLAVWLLVSRATAALGPYVLIVVAGTYGLVYTIVKRVAQEILP